MSTHTNSRHKSRPKTHRPTNDTFERARSVVVNHFDVDPGKVSLMVSFIDDLGANSLDALAHLIHRTRRPRCHNVYTTAMYTLRRRLT